MANDTATAKMILTYVPEGETAAVTETTTIACPYKASSRGKIDVPDLTAGATAFAVPFGGVGDDATLVKVTNETGQDLDVKVNGEVASPASLPDGASLLLAAPAEAGVDGTPITSLSLTTTGAQAGDGAIYYRVFGDPLAVP